MGSDESKRTEPVSTATDNHVHSYAQEIGESERSRTSSTSSNKSDDAVETLPNMGTMVVVKKNNKIKPNLERDEDFIKLQDIPTFLPILRGSLNIPNMTDVNFVEQLDPALITDLSTRYRDHLRKSAEVIAERQTLVVLRVREVESGINECMEGLVQRQKQYGKYAEHVNKIKEVSAVLKKVQRCVTEIIPLMGDINQMFPSDLRLEPLILPQPSQFYVPS